MLELTQWPCLTHRLAHLGASFTGYPEAFFELLRLDAGRDELSLESLDLLPHLGELSRGGAPPAEFIAACDSLNARAAPSACTFKACRDSVRTARRLAPASPMLSPSAPEL